MSTDHQEAQVPPEYLDAAHQALERFPIEARCIEPVMHSENVTFRVTDSDDEARYVLRLHRPGYNSLEELESERMWVEALQATGVPVPQPLQTLDGNHFSPVEIPGKSEQRFAGMTRWLPGRPLSDLPESGESDGRRRMLYRIGEIAAVFHNQSAGWREPEGFIRRRLDLDSLLGEKPFWGRFWNHRDLDRAERELLLRTRDELRGSLRAYGEQPRSFSLIHADLTLDNVLYHGDRLAVIDFDDCAYGWHLYDLTGLLIECVNDSGFPELQQALVEGYCSVRNLETRDRQLLADFLLVRGLALIGWFHQRPELEEDDYFNPIKQWVIDTCASR